MRLIAIWASFIILMTISKKLDQLHYILFSSSILYFTYICNRISPFELTLHKALLCLFVPSLIFWYIAFVYNDFLSLAPINYEYFVLIFFSYFYTLFYLLMKSV